MPQAAWEEMKIVSINNSEKQEGKGGGRKLLTYFLWNGTEIRSVRLRMRYILYSGV